MNNAKLAIERLKELLFYEKETGNLVWKKTTSNRVKVGAIAGRVDKYGYRDIRIDNAFYKAHRLVWFYCHLHYPENLIDHIDGDSSNNKIDNLRLATQSINQQNLKKAKRNSKTQVLGVGKKRNKYYARIRINNKQVNLGSFSSLDEARECYLLNKRTYHAGCTI